MAATKSANSAPRKRRTMQRTTAQSAATTPAKEDTAAVDTVVTKPTDKRVRYDKDEPIECRSVTAGTMVYIGIKTNTPYTWSNIGDIAYLDFEDVMAAVMSRSGYVMNPYFVIEDEALLEDPRLAEVKELYASMYNDGDVNAIMQLGVSDFEAALTRAPHGLKNAVKAEISRGIGDGTLDSIQKVRIADKVLGTDMARLLV